MKFGMEQTEHAAGGTLAHSLVCGRERLRKGKVLDEKDVRKLIRCCYGQVAFTRLEDHDAEKNLAATRVADWVISQVVCCHIPSEREFFVWE